MLASLDASVEDAQEGIFIADRCIYSGLRSLTWK